MDSHLLKHNIVAPVGEHLESTFVAIREFPTERFYLLSTGRDREKVEELKKAIAPFKISVQEVEIKGNLLEGMFRAFAQIKAAAPEESLLVNVSSGDNMQNCSALAASYVNGLKAFSVVADKIVMLPVLKFSYYKLMPERKLNILKFLKAQPDCCSSLEDLARRLKMSLPLTSYHINGNAKAEGLVSQGLVEVHIGPRGRAQVMLTELGRLIAEGLIETPQAIAV
jgi:DNA-binding transcriptional ArsR family regulator